jgi:hypothetical protein
MRGGGYKKAPDPAIWNQTRGTPYAGKAFSRAGAPRISLSGFKGSSWAAKKGHAAADRTERLMGPKA